MEPVLLAQYLHESIEPVRDVDAGGTYRGGTICRRREYSKVHDIRHVYVLWYICICNKVGAPSMNVGVYENSTYHGAWGVVGEARGESGV